mmetsp:Transcript_45927/g.121906  ORF Transcript_45927/g.121906 Transcript_45927/m.121906 type:complete len:83 (+) Transcript_45927:163-411(+)
MMDTIPPYDSSCQIVHLENESEQKWMTSWNVVLALCTKNLHQLYLITWTNRRHEQQKVTHKRPGVVCRRSISTTRSLVMKKR